MLEKCKKALRITEDDFDEEIQDLIDSCENELETSGVDPEYAPTLYEKAIITFVKRDFGWNNDDYEKLDKSYNNQKIYLMRIGDSNE